MFKLHCLSLVSTTDDGSPLDVILGSIEAKKREYVYEVERYLHLRREHSSVLGRLGN